MRRGAAVLALALAVLAAGPAPVVDGAVDRERSGGVANPVSTPAAAGAPTSDGFTSPACTTPALFSQISASARRDCAISGVAVAPVPLANYAIDTNIDSGLGASFGDDADSVVQDLLITPIWTALVWLVHAVVVALEWCYTIDLLAPELMGQVGHALASAEEIFTEPWLGLALSSAGVACAWNGLVRRRIAETVGEAALMLAMIAVGLWLIADPAGTVGAVSELADHAALGTLAAASAGNAAAPVGSLESALGEVFDSAITGPWCYMEFGSVEWCRDSSALDPRLLAVSRKLERLYDAGASCASNAPGLVVCAPGGSAEQHSYASTAMALEAARTNGALFLALPPGDLARDALASETTLPSLYATLCGGTDPTACTAGTAPQAEFRTAAGTWPRAGGLLLIAIGTAGMLATLTFIALRLIGAALGLLAYLLLAPLAVLAPAFGYGGRSTFRRWLLRLLGAAFAKLVYSVLLGVVLLISGLLGGITIFGWWTQWLLVSAFWWLAFEHRHTVLASVIHERAEPASRLPLATRLRYGARTIGMGARGARAAGHGAARTVGAAGEVWGRMRERTRDPASANPPGGGTGRMQARAQLDRQLHASLAAQRGGHAFVAAAENLDERRARLIEAESVAREAGDRRRIVSIGRRRRALESELVRRQTLGAAPTRAERRTAAEQLDSEARRAPRGYPARDYAALAGLAGLSRGGYERLAAREKLAARVEIERELGRRRELLGRVGAASGQRFAGGLASTSSAPRTVGSRERQFSPWIRG